MRSAFDFAPYRRSTVGFDRLFSMLDGFEAAPGYPPYNIERTGENDYRISVAVAGFTDADLSIEAKENTLTIHGEKQTNDEEETGEVLYELLTPGEVITIQDGEVYANGVLLRKAHQTMLDAHQLAGQHDGSQGPG